MAKKVGSCAVERVNIPEPTKRHLFAASAGYCGNPDCHAPLFPEDDRDIHFGELAHIIAASTNGPRDVSSTILNGVGRSRFANILLLCANCHTVVDKDDEAYPFELLTTWKRDHQDTITAAFSITRFELRSDARLTFLPLVDKNKAFYTLHGPQTLAESGIGASHARVWGRSVRRTIIPNNRLILKFIETNRHLLVHEEIELLQKFTVHVVDFEARHIWSDWSTGGARYPEGLDALFEKTKEAS